VKVHELIEVLKQFPGDMLVLTDGYEGGYEEIRPPKIIDVKHEPQKPAYEGEYQDTEEKNGVSIKAVVVFRNRRPE
jgi:hypothetical protein